MWKSMVTKKGINRAVHEYVVKTKGVFFLVCSKEGRESANIYKCLFDPQRKTDRPDIPASYLPGKYLLLFHDNLLHDSSASVATYTSRRYNSLLTVPGQVDRSSSIVTLPFLNKYG